MGKSNEESGWKAQETSQKLLPGELRWGLLGPIPTELHLPGFTILFNSHRDSKRHFFNRF